MDLGKAPTIYRFNIENSGLVAWDDRFSWKTAPALRPASIAKLAMRVHRSQGYAASSAVGKTRRPF